MPRAPPPRACHAGRSFAAGPDARTVLRGGSGELRGEALEGVGVDDEEAVRKSLAFLLTMAGFTVRVHDSATAFLEAAPSVRHGCLVTDLRMPVMSGFEVHDWLESNRPDLFARLVIATGDVACYMELHIEQGALLELLAHLAHRRALELEALAEIRRDVARGAAEPEHRVLLGLLEGRPAHEVRVLVGLEVAEPHDHRPGVVRGGELREAQRQRVRDVREHELCDDERDDEQQVDEAPGRSQEESSASR